MPKAVGMEGPVISASSMATLWPRRRISAAIRLVTSDLPTPPLPLTVFQSLPVDGIVVVATPQELVGMIVEKAVNMAAMMNIPVLGLVENMASFRCPDCGKVHAIFGESHVDEIAKKHGVSPVCRLPINPKLSAAVDAGAIELAEEDGLDALTAKLAGMLQ